MVSIAEASESYKEPETLNISDLENFSVAEELQTFHGTNSAGEDFSYDYIERDGVKYRVPASVIKQIKALREKKPELMEFQVLRTGTGKNDTTYNVIPAETKKK